MPSHAFRVPRIRTMTHWWPFIEGTGTTVRDIYGGVDCSLVSTPPWASGEFGQYVTLDGSADYGDLGNNVALGYNQPWSICAVIRPTLAANGWIFAKQTGSGTPSYRGYGFLINSSGYLYIEIINSADGANWLICTGNTNALSSGTDYFVAMTYDGSTNASGITFYVGTTTQGVTINQDTLSATIANSTSANIGRRAGDGSSPFPGRVYGVAVYDSELTADEITYLNRYFSGYS